MSSSKNVTDKYYCGSSSSFLTKLKKKIDAQFKFFEKKCFFIKKIGFLQIKIIKL